MDLEGDYTALLAEYQHLLESHAALKARVAQLEATDHEKTHQKLRQALLTIAGTVGAKLGPDVSDDFLCLVPEEVRLVVQKLEEKAAGGGAMEALRNKIFSNKYHELLAELRKMCS